LYCTQSIAETLRKDVPDAIKVAFESLKDQKYKTRDKSVKNVNKFDKVELSLLLCDDAFIKKLNKEWRDEDSVTDVLSMSQHIPGLAIPIVSHLLSSLFFLTSSFC
jgi:ssRNA-specific RNase YbeY (16S rRNA maturation enzyme)